MGVTWWDFFFLAEQNTVIDWQLADFVCDVSERVENIGDWLKS